MTIWLNVTTTNRWNGHAVGISRVELELASALKERIKFFEIRDREFKEVAYQQIISEKDVEKKKYVPRNSRLFQFFDAQKGTSTSWLILKMGGIALSLIMRVLPDNFQESILSNLYRVIRKFDKQLKKRISPIRVDDKSAKNSGINRIPSSELTSVDFTINHPFHHGDTVVSCGLDWDYSLVEYVNLIKSEIDFKFVTWIYDVIPVYYPEVISSVSHCARLFKHFALVGGVADEVVYISENTRRDFEKFCHQIGLKTPPGRVITLASDFEISTPKEGETLELSRFGIRGQYILSVGTLEPRKNYWTLVNARSSMVSDEGLQLVIIGRVGWSTGDLLTYVNHQKGKNVIILNNITDDELNQLYQNASALMSASIAEGFNLPALEAQSAGLPTFLSDIPTHRELFPQAEFIATFDTPAWSRAMQEVAQGRYPKSVKPFIGKRWNEYADEVIALLKM